MARRRHFPVAPVSKRQTDWVGVADQGFVAVGAGATIILNSFTPSAANMVRPTITRSRGSFGIRPASAGTDQAIIGVLGICVVTTVAFTAGVASVPGPFSDAGWNGWFVWEPFSNFLEVTTDIGRFLGSWERLVDSKAMRRIGDEDTMITVVESQGVAFDVSANIRTLFKLS